MCTNEQNYTEIQETNYKTNYDFQYNLNIKAFQSILDKIHQINDSYNCSANDFANTGIIIICNSNSQFLAEITTVSHYNTDSSKVIGFPLNIITSNATD